jgi:hypothetical protein
MLKTKKAPTPEAAGASLGDLLGGSIIVEVTESALERQARMIRTRVSVSAHFAAVLAAHAFRGGVQ